MISTRTTVTLDDEVLERLRAEGRSRGGPFREALDGVLRAGLRVVQAQGPRPPFKVQARPMGRLPGLNYDNTEALLQVAEGEHHL